MSYDIAVIGTGNPDQSDTFAMAYRHAQAYQQLEECEIVACADIVTENAKAFAKTFEIAKTEIYEDYNRMLEQAAPDIVSICTPPKTHADIVLDCADSGAVAAIHCEKPMAATWSGCREMVRECEQQDVQLTFNHQRRFATPYRKAKSVVDDGRIGELQRIEIGGNNLYDYGSHLFDMCGFMTEQTPVEWVLGQVDHSETETLYGIHQEREALARWRYESGVDGLASTGERGVVDCELRLVGEAGTIEVGADEGPSLRIRTDSGWSSVDTGRDGVWRPQTHPVDRAVEQLPIGPDRLLSNSSYVDRAVEDVVTAVHTGSKSTLSASNTVQSTEIIFACWESARRGGRVDLPLDIDDNPLEAIVERRQDTQRQV